MADGKLNERGDDIPIGTKFDFQFKTGIYCTKGVPFGSGASQNVYVGEPFWVNNWECQFTAETDATGKKVFSHP